MNVHSETTAALFDAMLSLKTQEECRQFFDDLCTVNEIQSMAQRFEVVNMLADKKNYQEIAAQTGASSATISRVNRCLRYGTGGYRLVLERRGTQDADT